MQSHIVKIIGGVAGLVLVVVGVLKTINGIKELTGGGANAQVSALIKDGNAQVDAANKFTLEAAPKYQKILNDVDTVGLAEVRGKQKAEVEGVEETFKQSGDKFREAAKTLADAAKLSEIDVQKQYLTLKSQAYEKYAATKDGAREILKLVLDESIADADTLIAKVGPITTNIETSKKEGDDLAAQADKITTDHPDIFGGKE